MGSEGSSRQLLKVEVRLAPDSQQVKFASNVFDGRRTSGSHAKETESLSDITGLHDLAIAAPSMKAAAEAWGASPDLFRDGFAKQSDDREVITAAMAQPGVVLRRPVGSKKRFREHAELPSAESLSEHFARNGGPGKKAVAPQSPKTDEEAEGYAARKKARDAAEKANEQGERKAAAAFEKAERRRRVQRQKKEAAAARARARRHAAIEKAKSALEKARLEHNERAAAIERDREAIESRAKKEKMRWEKLESRLEAALQKANG